MNKDELVKKIRRQPKWKIEKEREELQMQQKAIRVETEELSKRLSQLKDDAIVALKGNAKEESIAVIDSQIDAISKRIAENDKRYKANAEVLEIYSKISKNDTDRNNGRWATLTAFLVGASGVVLGAIGLEKSYAYDTETEVTTVRKNVLDWTRRLPVFRGGPMIKK